MAPRPALQTTAASTSRLVDLKKAAEVFDCSERTVRRMIAAGEITGYRVGKRLLRVDLNELQQVARVIPSGAA
jgi:excisionase family DNA binding protein